MNLFRVDEKKIKYTGMVVDTEKYTEKMNSEYNWMAKIYDLFLFIFPLWKRWIKKVIPHITGNKILEVSFGSGYLMTKYGGQNEFDLTGIDYNEKMVEVTNRKIKAKNITANLIKANVPVVN